MTFVLETFPSRKNGGTSFLTWLPMVLIGLVVVFSVYVLAQTFMTEEEQQEAFEGWLTDVEGYNMALQEYARSDRPMIVYFHADWCPHCRRLKENVLTTPSFRAYTQDYIRVKVTPDSGEAERLLMNSYGATGYPSFFVIPPGKPADQPFETAGTLINTYTPQGTHKTPAQFIAEMEEIVQ